MAAVEEQVVEPHAGQVAGAPVLELIGQALADANDRRAADGGLGPERLGEHGLDVAVRQAAYPAGDDEALEGVGARRTSAEELLHRGGAHAGKLRALDLNRPQGGVDGARRLPAVAVTLDGVVAAAFVALTAQLVGDDLLQDGLEGEADAQAGDPLQCLSELHIAVEGLVDLRAQALDR